jgi:murein DD-endopeptidase MepM/ murein hydrolase activator NlpD
MPRSLLVAVVALATVAGTARADTFAVVPSTAVSLPSSAAANADGSLALPPAWTSRPAQPQQLDYAQLLALWRRAGAAYAVPWQVLAAINKIESNFGRNMGPSSAGAIGWMQFMPSTWLRWGVDANGDGVASPWDAQDAVFAASRYLSAAGAVDDLRRAIYAYNHADWYVNEVLALARVYVAGGDSGTATLERLSVKLDGARRTLARVGDRVVRGQLEARRLAVRERRVLARARATRSLTARLALERSAALLEVRRQSALRRVGRAERAATRAQQTLQQASAQARPAAFASGTRPVFASPDYAGRWVFPVGGGPGSVSAAHTHHDYPAVDIAAPMGAPVYALSDATVLRAWHEADPRCGIGMTIRTGDGQTWTYCHLSFLEPQIAAGVQLTAGQQVGLVGATGDATGPHLHLQLQPATQWPQRESWFEAFAGSAFRWQDAPTPQLRTIAAAAPARGPVFQVVEDDSDVVAFTR